DRRLVKEKITDPSGVSRVIADTYDPAGNRLTRNDSVEGITTYQYDANDRLVAVTHTGETTLYYYTDAGDLLTRADAGDRGLYAWDAQHRLAGVDLDGDGRLDETYRYDADGIRVSRTAGGQETRFLIDVNRPFAEAVEEYTPEGTVLASYILG